MKLSAHRAGLPGKVISFYIVPLDPAYPALAGRGTFRSQYPRFLQFERDLKMNPGPAQPIRIWIAEDEDELREILRDSLSGGNRTVRVFQNGREVLEALKKEGFDILLTDLIMPEVDGIELLNEVKSRYPDSIVIIMTGYASLDSAIQAIRGGAYDYIRKPFKLDELEILIQNGCEKISLIRENRDLLRMLKETKEELGRLKETWDEHLSHVLSICWMMFGEKKNPEMELILKQVSPLAPDFDLKKREAEEKALESLQRLADLKKERSITEQEFSTFKKILLKKLK
ncbi:MAG: response regulator [Deltaproteobacteria bacterium]|nr:response regulator [Deltaproteobacteria bacterium]